MSIPTLRPGRKRDLTSKRDWKVMERRLWCCLPGCVGATRSEEFRDKFFRMEMNLQVWGDPADSRELRGHIGVYRSIVSNLLKCVDVPEIKEKFVEAKKDAGGRRFLVIVSCKSGRHRSVFMALFVRVLRLLIWDETVIVARAASAEWKGMACGGSCDR